MFAFELKWDIRRYLLGSFLAIRFVCLDTCGVTSLRMRCFVRWFWYRKVAGSYRLANNNPSSFFQMFAYNCFCHEDRQ